MILNMKSFEEDSPMYHKIYGSMMGTALGDSIGLPYEALSRQKIAKKKPKFEAQSLFLGRGMFSDDTEQTVAVAQTLIESYDDLGAFQKGMKRRLQLWLLALPAGVGFATMKAIVKSFFVQDAGVFSAGNGPAMRSALLGLCFGDDDEKLKSFVRANTSLTHTDPKAYYGSLAVAKAAYLSSTDQQDKFFVDMRTLIKDVEFRDILQSVEDDLSIPTTDFALKLGFDKGVSGYIYHTLPIVLHAWLRNPHDLKQAIIDVILCGGDTDTTAAIVGSIVGADGETLPKEWIEGIVDYPLNAKHIEENARVLTEVFEEQKVTKAPSLFWLATLVRNFIFLVIVLVVSVTRQF